MSTRNDRPNIHNVKALKSLDGSRQVDWYKQHIQSCLDLINRVPLGLGQHVSVASIRIGRSATNGLSYFFALGNVGEVYIAVGYDTLVPCPVSSVPIDLLRSAVLLLDMVQTIAGANKPDLAARMDQLAEIERVAREDDEADIHEE